MWEQPSPTEKRSFWGRTPSTTTSSHRSVLSDNEPFSISRESFDSYRRSFVRFPTHSSSSPYHWLSCRPYPSTTRLHRHPTDKNRRTQDISARSPISHPDCAPLPTRQSLDSYSPRAAHHHHHHHHPPPRSAFHARAPNLTPTSPTPTPLKSDAPSEHQPRVVDAEVFEDVGLADAPTQPQQPHDGAAKPQAKKRGLFARFGEGSPAPVGDGVEERPGSSHRGFHLPGRKRGQSGQGAELRAMPRAGGEGEGVAVR